MEKNLEQYIRNIPDFPKQGILFRDITTLLNDKDGFKKSIDQTVASLKDKKIDYIVAAESRGFIFGGALSYQLGCGFVPVRKPGRLPYKTYKHVYQLEYGQDALEIHTDAFPPKSKVLIFDDVLATGGTSEAIIKLVEKLQGEVVGISLLIELVDLKGREKLKDYWVNSLIKF